MKNIFSLSKKKIVYALYEPANLESSRKYVL